MTRKKTIQRITEPTKRVPVLRDADVVVAGGGIAGTFAALSAARNGAKTVLVDRFGMPGGNMGPGFVNAGGMGPEPDPVTGEWPDSTHVKGGITGIPREFRGRHIELCGGRDGFAVWSNAASYLAMKMLQESGVTMLLSAYVSDPIVKRGRISGVFVETKSGRVAIRSKVVVDATGEADVARRAGCPILQPKPEYTAVDHHAPFGAGLYYTIGGVNLSRYRRLIKQYQLNPADKRWAKRHLGYYADSIAHLIPCIRKAKKAGEDISLVEGDVFWRPLGKGRRVKAGFPRPGRDKGLVEGRTGFLRVDTGDALDTARYEAAARMVIFEAVQFLKEHVPGYENAYLVCIAPYLGARGGPCIKGEVTLRTEDFVAGTRFPDVVFIFGHVSGGKDIELGHGKWTDYPYRVMLPEKLDGLIAVGRSASAIPDTLIRGRFKAMHTGEIGGLAAALCAKKGVTPKGLDVKALQKALLKKGYHLGDRERLREIGLA